MEKTRKFWFAAALALLLGMLALAGCGGATEAPPPTEVAVQPAATTPPTQPPTVAPTDTPLPPTDTPVPTDTPEPTATPAPEPVDNSACVGCHTSQEVLQAMAVSEEVEESLSEGEG